MEMNMNNVNKTLYIPLYGKAYVSRKGIILNDKKEFVNKIVKFSNLLVDKPRLSGCECFLKIHKTKKRVYQSFLIR